MMRKNILNEVSYMKYLLDYRRGVVISEQKLLNEDLQADYNAIHDQEKSKPTYKTGDTYSFEIKSSDTSDPDCLTTVYNDGDVIKELCKSSRGTEAQRVWGKWFWDGTNWTTNFRGENITTDAEGYYGDSDTVYSAEKIANIGASGPFVKQIQAWLVSDGWGDAVEVGGNAECSRDNVDKCDGIYGPKTKEAVKKFQEEAEILDDGIFGKETYQASPL